MFRLGQPIPETPHAVSVSLPTWQDNIDYEEGHPRVVNAMKGGYPRFVFHPMVKKLLNFCSDKFGSKYHQDALVLNSRRACIECREFISKRVKKNDHIILVDFLITPDYLSNPINVPVINIILFPQEYSKIAKEFWQHTGLGVSSRYAEYCLVKLHLHFPKIEGTSKYLEHEETLRLKEDYLNESYFVEERYGRNLATELACEAKLILRKRIAGSIVQSSQGIIDNNVINRGRIGQENVKLFSSGMASVYFAHQIVTGLYPNLKTVQFGFPYIDTLKLQQKFGSGCIFFGYGDCRDLATLVDLLMVTKISGLFCEFPSNPLLRSPPLKELWKLANEYGFLLIVDETIGNFANINVLPFCHLIVSSLTKIFSGDSNVMGGSLVVNPYSNFANQIDAYITQNYKDLLFYEDAIFLERNSRGFVDRIIYINRSTEALCDMLKEHPLVSEIYYPKYTTSKSYEELWTGTKGYGGLFSIVLKTSEIAKQFYDQIKIRKGPSLGTNFTLACPYAILAHYNELDWAKEYDIQPHLIRISIGLEDFDALAKIFLSTLDNIVESFYFLVYLKHQLRGSGVLCIKRANERKRLTQMASASNNSKRPSSEEEDELLEKKRIRIMKNRIAAQESRNRQKEYVRNLEMINMELLKSQATLQQRLNLLEAQNALLFANLQNMLPPTSNPEIISPMVTDSSYLNSTASADLCNTTVPDSPINLQQLINMDELLEWPAESKEFKFIQNANINEINKDIMHPAVVSSQKLMTLSVSLMSQDGLKIAPMMLFAYCSLLSLVFERGFVQKLNDERWKSVLAKKYPICYQFLINK